MMMMIGGKMRMERILRGIRTQSTIYSTNTNRQTTTPTNTQGGSNGRTWLLAVLICFAVDALHKPNYTISKFISGGPLH